MRRLGVSLVFAALLLGAPSPAHADTSSVAVQRGGSVWLQPAPGVGWSDIVSFQREYNVVGGTDTAHFDVRLCYSPPMADVVCDYGYGFVDVAGNDIDALARNASMHATLPSTNHPGDTITINLDVNAQPNVPPCVGGFCSNVSAGSGTISSTYFKNTFAISNPWGYIVTGVDVSSGLVPA